MTSSMGDSLDRAIGALLGLACGDAVGTTLEFKAPGSFEPISDMVGGGPFELPAGIDTLREKLMADKGREIKAVTITHNETSTGVLNDLQKIALAVREHSRARRASRGGTAAQGPGPGARAVRR